MFAAARTWRVALGAAARRLPGASRPGAPRQAQPPQLYARRAFTPSRPRRERKRDYFEVLGVSRGEDKSAVKKAYFAIAKKYHPDTNKDDKDAVKKFQEASEAYEVLSDDDKRQAYEQFGHAAVDGSMGNGGGGGGGYENPFDTFASAFGGRNRATFHQGFGGQGGQEIDLEDFFDMFGGGGQRRSRGPKRGVDLTFMLRLSFMESARGIGDKLIEWHEVLQDGRKGKKLSERIAVPQGVETGMQMTIKGKGGAGDAGAPKGDLHVQFQVDKDPYFERDGPDVHVECELALWDAALGTTLNVLTLDGMVEVDVPAGAQPGQKLRLRGKGLMHVNSRGRGNQIIHLKIVTPAALTPRQTELLRELQASDPLGQGKAVDAKTRAAAQRLASFF
ncbi:hypothetical protein M885DRAFT_491539 [Pelagophyceae sp. CCMP2097]|nr:hypothetical protein M885DRAFT_491539 [Pelagophyceae sp. CCMP2097]